MPATHAPILLHSCGVKYTLTPNGIYIEAPAQQVQERPYQPIAEWPRLPEFRVFWPWPQIRLLFDCEDRAAKAERRRRSAKGHGIVVTIDGVEMPDPIKPRWPGGTDPMMIAWLGRIREQALAQEPVRVEYGKDGANKGGYRTRLVGAWTHLPRKDLGKSLDGSEAPAVASLDEARARAEAIRARLQRAGRMPVLLEAEAV